MLKLKVVCIHIYRHKYAPFHKINIFCRNMSHTQNEREIAEKHNYDLILVAFLMIKERGRKKRTLAVPD